MWMMTRHGFYSIVRQGREQGQYQVRARERGDLEPLIAPGGPFQGREILEGSTDYHYRVFVSRRQLEIFLLGLAESLDYYNFKAQIDRTPSQRNKPYHKVWAALAAALGAYGREGRRAETDQLALIP